MNDDSSTDPELSSLVVGFFSTKKNKQTKKNLDIHSLESWMIRKDNIIYLLLLKLLFHISNFSGSYIIYNVYKKY